MKSRYIFWGIFFLSLGVLILLNNYGSLSFDWETILKLSPVIFILWGISILLKQNKVINGFFAALIAFILALTIFSGFKFILGFSDWDFDVDWNDDKEVVFDGNYDSTFYNAAFDPEIKNAVLNFDGGAGKIIISDTSGSLIQAYSFGAKNNYKFTIKNSDETSKIYFDMQKTRIRFKKKHNEVDIKLNTNPVWNLDFDLGAASADLDLTKFKVKEFNIDAGAASLNISMGDKIESAKINIDAGASSIKINVPHSSGCEINSDTFLSSNHFEGFEKINSNKFRTENFDSSEKKIYINIDSGISSIKVNRYENDVWK